MKPKSIKFKGKVENGKLKLFKGNFKSKYMIELNPSQIIKSADFKGKNKRINLLIFHDDKADEIAAVIYTKSLKGKWQDRDIFESKVCYGYETLSFIH